MQTTILPIYDQDASKVFQEFLAEEFYTQQLGRPGRWLLLGDEQPALANPVRASDVEKLLAASRSPDALDEPVAWRFKFEVGRSVTSLWALSPETTSQGIENAHGQAVEMALNYWCSELSPPRGAGLHANPSATFALFVSGTGKRQIPYLHTTAFLFNTPLSPRVEQPRFPAEKVIETADNLDLAYTGLHGALMTDTIGLIDTSQRTDVPRKIFSRQIESSDQAAGHYAMYGGPLTGQALLTEWRRSAAKNGFSPRQVEEVLFHAKRAATSREASHYQLLSLSALGKRLGRWFRQGRESFHSLISSPKLSSQQTAIPPKANSAQPSHTKDTSHSH
jgi:hypothetical protein